MNIKWNVENYTDNFGFVYGYGEEVTQLFDLPGGSFVADVGCGGGQLTHKLAVKGYGVCGIDASADMIALAKRQFPDIDFKVDDATKFTLPRPADGIFSNAVFHWIDDQRALIANLARNLRRGGQLVCEFGGKGCGETVHAALKEAFEGEGLSYRNPFYFPTIGEYAPLLEEGGLRPVYCSLFPRPTLQQGEDGLKNWIKMFVRVPFEGMDEDRKERVLSDAERRARPALYRDGKWYVDYVRIRIKAVRI